MDVTPKDGERCNLFRDRTFYWQGRLRKKRRWSREGDRLVLWEDGRRANLLEYRPRCDLPRPERHGVASPTGDARRFEAPHALGRHAIVTFSRQAAENLKARCPSATWIVPFVSYDALTPPPPGEFVFAGSIDYRSKAVSSLLSACATLAANESLLILGGSRYANLAEDPQVDRLIRDLPACGLADKVRFTGYLPYGEFVERLRRSRFLLPLVDDRISAGGYL